MKTNVLFVLLTLAIALLPVSNGYTQTYPGLIRGWAFLDQDQDGVRDPTEQGLPGTVICLVGYDWCDHTEWGEFEFDGLAPGRYKVKLVEFPAGYHLTTRRQYVIELGVGEIRTGVNFGLTAIPGEGHLSAP